MRIKNFRIGMFLTIIFLVFVNIGNAQIEKISENVLVLEKGGTGPYTAIVTQEKALPGMTIYRPEDLSKFGDNQKLPILLWGNGACANSTEEHKNFLNEIASHGYIVLGIGPLSTIENPDREVTRQATSSKQLISALDWISAENQMAESKYSGKIDVSQVAVMGMSCGGLQAIEVSADPRIKTHVICNSGVKIAPTNINVANPGMPNPSKEALMNFHNPVLYIMGGETDIAYNNAMDDFQKIKHVPVVMTNHDVGHGGTYRQPYGGAFTGTALAWLNWQLRGDEEASKMFLGDDCGLCEDQKWTIETKNF